jgi:hypothetical protein
MGLKMTEVGEQTKIGGAAAAAATIASIDASSPIAPISPKHDPYRRTTDLLQRLAPGKMRIGFFLGAGCPLAIQLPDGANKKPIIPEISGLTAQVKLVLEANDELKSITSDIWSRVCKRGIGTPSIEDVLSHIRTLRSLCGTDGIDGFTDELLEKLDGQICDEVRKIVKVTLPENGTPYHIVASWIQAIAREKPVEVFTTNYDLLLEQALEAQRVPYFDGFVGSDSAFLDLESMAEDDLPPRWARLWKIHGSINWWMTDKKKIRRSRDKIDGEQLLIYPSHLKYDQSRQMPYYAMLDRLRVFLRTDQCVLIICGYSFADEHINAYIGQGLSGNPNASCIAMMFKDRTDVPKAVELAKRHANLSVLAADGGIVGTVDREWHSFVNTNNTAYEIAVGVDMPNWRTKAPTDQCKWLLGDFEALGRFLAHQLASRDIEQGVQDAP